MTRILGLTILFITLSALAHADSALTPRPPHEVVQFQRNLPLVEALIDSGVRLVEEEDALVRAEACAAVARRFVSEIELAAEQDDALRTVELGRRLHDLLRYGVAENLRSARRRIPQGSTGELRWQQVNRLALDLMKPFHESLVRAGTVEDRQEFRALVDDLLRRQQALEKLLHLATPMGVQ